MNDTPDAERELLTLLTARVRDAMGPASEASCGAEAIGIDADADLFDAMALLLRHRVQSLCVRGGDGAVLGVLGQTELLAGLARHSHVAAVQIEQATSIDDLAPAAQRVDAMVRALADSGTRIERITHLVGTLNRSLIARAWSLVAAPELVVNSCLLVMGSEGRSEQIQKTDQDNALVLRDGLALPVAQVAAATAALADALARMGWPPCPGRIMVTNPRWCAPLADFRERLREWVHGPDPEGPLHLAIFFDAAAVAGDASLLHELERHLDRVATNSDAFLARFAAAADQFHAPVRWWQRLSGSSDEQALDLKKIGTFPIVHGVRALALAHGARAPDTAQRIGQLVARQVFDAALGQDLIEALHYLMGLKLRRQLAQRAAGALPDNLVRPSALSTMEREQLEAALAITQRLRELLRQRFRLDSL